MSRPPNAIDFWRGFALVSIFVNHIPGIYYEHFTHRNLSISDSADLFVFLAGWALRLTTEQKGQPVPLSRLVPRLGGRAVTIYAAHMLLVTLAIAMLAGAARWRDNPLLLEWHNAAAVFYDPVNSHIGLALLTHQLGYFDILPLYVVLMVMAMGFVVLHRVRPGWLLPVSAGVYLGALTFRVIPPSWPIEGHWFFNPLAWQLLFVLGFLLAGEDGVGGLVRRHMPALRLAALPIVIGTALMVRYNWWWDPTKVPEPRLLFLMSKTYVTPPRMIHFLALAAVCSAVYPFVELWFWWLARFFAKLGRNSLQVFCVGSILSLACQIFRYVYNAGVLADTCIVLGGICALGLTAWLSERKSDPKRRE